MSVAGASVIMHHEAGGRSPRPFPKKSGKPPRSWGKISCNPLGFNKPTS